MIENRYYTVNGTKWEARFFSKGELFPETDTQVPRQGVWARPASRGWETAAYVGHAWAAVHLDPDVLYFPEKK